MIIIHTVDAKFKIERMDIAGRRYHDVQDALILEDAWSGWDGSLVLTSFFLVPEPWNLYDKEAVSIYCRAFGLPVVRVGYVPRAMEWKDKVFTALHKNDAIVEIVGPTCGVSRSVKGNLVPTLYYMPTTFFPMVAAIDGYGT